MIGAQITIQHTQKVAESKSKTLNGAFAMTGEIKKGGAMVVVVVGAKSSY